MDKFTPAAPGEVRGPWKSSPGNPQPWQAAYYNGDSWAYFFGQTPSEVVSATREAAAAWLESIGSEPN